MKYLKAFLPYFFVIMFKIMISVSIVPGQMTETIYKMIVYYYFPYIIVLCMFWIYFNTLKSAKWIFSIGLLVVIVNIVVQYGPFLWNIMMHFNLGSLFIFSEFNLIFYTAFGVIALIYSLKHKSYVGLILAITSIALIIFVDLFYLPSLDYNPIEEFKSLLKFEMYHSIGRSLFGLMLIPLTIFTTNLSIFFSVKSIESQVKSS